MLKKTHSYSTILIYFMSLIFSAKLILWYGILCMSEYTSNILKWEEKWSYCTIDEHINTISGTEIQLLC